MPTQRRPNIRDVNLLAALGLALLLKALVPAGWMPAFENGSFALRLCGGWVPAAAEPPATHGQHGMGHGTSAPAQHGDGHEGPQQDADQPCSFAISGQFWTQAARGGTAALGIGSSAAARLFPQIVAIGSGLAAPPPPATGPPLLT